VVEGEVVKVGARFGFTSGDDEKEKLCDHRSLEERDLRDSLRAGSAGYFCQHMGQGACLFVQVSQRILVLGLLIGLPHP